MGPFSGEERNAILALARRAVGAAIRGEPPPDLDDVPVLHRPAAAFVTLTVGRELRGCIGFVEAHHPLGQVVCQAGAAAATQDPRFAPVNVTELGALSIEISVLSALEPVDDPASIEIGRHGLVIELGPRRGLLLPQVPVEHGWDREQFLAQTCRKAGLPPEAWQAGARLLRFEAIVIHDREPR